LISIVIILYKSKDYINNCINSIVNSNLYDQVLEILIINNDSTEKYTFNNKKIQFHSMNKNIGYSKAMNFGINKALGEYILTLNPDTILSSNTIDIMLETYEIHNNVGAVGVKVLNSDNTFQLSSIRKFPTPHILFSKILNRFFKFVPNLYNYSNIDLNNFQDVDAISGCCMMIEKNTFENILGFDERFFMYFEDTDLCNRLVNNGKRVIYNPKTSINHFKVGSLSIFEKRFVNYKFYISMFRFIKKYYFKYITFLSLILFLLIIFILLCQNIY